MEQKTTVGQATASLVLGILSWVLFGIFAAIPAVICGHIAKSKIKKNPEHLQGEGQALAGIILGYLMIGLFLLIIPILAAIAIPLMTANKGLAAEICCETNMQMMEVGKQMLVIEENLPQGTPVSGDQLAPYIGCEFTDFQCIDQGIYTLNPIGTSPECSLHGPLDSLEESGEY